MNEFTPYKSLLLYHHVGTGKTIATISILDGLKNYVVDNGKKIIIVVPGPLFKESWKKEIL